MLRLKIPIWLQAAFLCGWLFAFLNILNVLVLFLEQAQGISRGATIPLLIVLLPPILGVVAALTVGRAKQHPILLALGTGLLALTGWYAYWLPGMIRIDAVAASVCLGANPPDSCHHGPYSGVSYINTTLLVWSWLIGSVLLILSTLVTYLLLFLIRKYRGKRLSSST